MGAVRSFRDLKVYLAAREAPKRVFEVTEHFPRYRTITRVNEEFYSPIAVHYSHVAAVEVNKQTENSLQDEEKWKLLRF